MIENEFGEPDNPCLKRRLSKPKLKSFECHVKDPQASDTMTAICGDDLMLQFYFLSIDHLYCSLKTGSRQVCCPECLKKIKQTIN